MEVCDWKLVDVHVYQMYRWIKVLKLPLDLEQAENVSKSKERYDLSPLNLLCFLIGKLPVD